MPNSPVLLIDLSSIAHPIWHVSQGEPDPDHTSQRTAAIVRQLAADHPHAAICCDSPVSFRKDVDPTYKANRPTAEAALHHQIDLAREALAADGFPVWRVDEFEGDDLIATATAKLVNTVTPNRVLIASADKDLLALVSEKVEVHSTRTGNRVGPAEVLEKLGVDPHQVADYLTLVGDASDNIKGAKGIGPKTASGLLEKFGTLDNIFAHLDDGHAEIVKPGQRKSLEELRPRLETVRALVHMRADVPLDVAEVFKTRVPTTTEDFLEVAQMEEMEGEMQKEKDKETESDAKRAANKPGLDAVREFLGPLDRSKDPTPPEPAVETAAPIAVVPIPAEWEHGLEPRSMEQAYRLAQSLHNSRMFFSDYGNPQAVLSTILLGRELGLPTMAALRSVHIIKGKHSLSAQLMVAIILNSGKADYFRLIESTDTSCTYETKRKGRTEPTTHTYTIDDARTAGLLDNDNWKKRPKPMLRARCSSELSRIEYPDLLAGLYTPEELRDAKNGD